MLAGIRPGAAQWRCRFRSWRPCGTGSMRSWRRLALRFGVQARLVSSAGGARFGDEEPAVPGGYERACRAGARGRRAGAAGRPRFLNLMTASRQTAKMNSSADTPVRERKRTVACSG